ncbi:MAG: FtsX-like permease family protein [Bacteroidetes bacterium]|nr:FtsX-like permease family protein [Bacteroidota bacterium]
MIKFLLNGVIRDKSRSRLPIIVVSVGVMLTVFLHAYITGFMGDALEMNAKFNYGHVKIMTNAYAENIELNPIDLAIIDVEDFLEKLNARYPHIKWSQRIQFGGLVDAPDEYGETKAQGPAFGLGLDILSPNSQEIDRLNLANSLVRGSLPANSGEILISELFSRKLQVNPGDDVTLIGSSMNGSMVMYNFTIAGTLSFGVDIMDKGSIIVDIEDVKIALDMNDAVSEIIGFLPDGYYNHKNALSIQDDFNSKCNNINDEFAPVMLTLGDQGGMGAYIELSQYWSWYITFVFIIAMSLVLWNAGLLGALRRYGEVGIRLAMGETKGHVYTSMIVESVIIGIIGSVFGTFLGLFFAFILQEYGLNIEGMMEGASVMFPNTINARITTMDFYIGFIPGVISTVIGTMLAGIGIYKRQTARLFKELEA